LIPFPRLARLSRPLGRIVRETVAPEARCLTFKTIATAVLLGGMFLATFLVCLVGHSQGVTLALEQARTLVGARPF
jgi:hypothetical protein